jgi:hypothetical protein
MLFTNGKLTRVRNQFGNGLGPPEATSASARMLPAKER